MDLYIITGGSRGLGNALSDFAINAGNHVANIARNGKQDSATCKSFITDLSNVHSKEDLFTSIFKQFPLVGYNRIHLINNAGLIKPIKKVIDFADDEILQNMLVNLYAPISLTSEFLKQTKSFKGELLLCNISSGVANHPLASWGLYSAAKSGLENFSGTLVDEYQGSSQVKIVNFNPGVMDTDMQSDIRKTPHDDFKNVKTFARYKDEGILRSPAEVANALGSFISRPNLPLRNFISIDEIL